MATNTTREISGTSRAKSLPKDEIRIDYLLECFRAAQEEVLLRIKNRDNWLRLQLLSQVALLALSQGIEIAGIKALQPNPDVLALSTAVSLVLAALYFMEDSSVNYLGNYIGALTDAEAELRQRKKKILNWNCSKQGEQHAERVFRIRYLAQLTAFVIIPITFVGWRILSIAVWGILQLIEMVMDVVFLIVILYLTRRGYLLKHEAFRGSRLPVLDDR